MIPVGSTNINAKKFIEPAAFAALAFLAGSTRLVEYLPGSSLRGFFLSAGASTATSFFYDQALRDPEHSSFRTIVGKAVAIGLATTLSVLAAKALQGRVQLSPKGALGFGAIQTFAVAIVVKATESTELEREWLQIMRHPHKLCFMPEEERSQKAQEFYKAGLPSIPMWDSWNPNWLPKLEDMGSLTDAQLTWAVVDEGSDEVQDLPSIFLQCLSRNSFPTRLPRLAFKNLINYCRGNEERVNILYDGMVQSPEFFHFMSENLQGQFSSLFEGKPPIPQVNYKLSLEELFTKNGIGMKVWENCLTNQEKWDECDPEVRAYKLEKWVIFGEKFPRGIREVPEDLSWVNNLSSSQLESLKIDQKQYIAEVYAKHPTSFAHLSQEQKAILENYRSDI